MMYTSIQYVCIHYLCICIGNYIFVVFIYIKLFIKILDYILVFQITQKRLIHYSLIMNSLPPFPLSGEGVGSPQPRHNSTHSLLENRLIFIQFLFFSQTFIIIKHLLCDVKPENPVLRHSAFPIQENHKTYA